MSSAFSRLLSIASDPIDFTPAGSAALEVWGDLGNELGALLEQRNGFYAYESALLVRPLRHAREPLGLLEWNAPQCWRTEYSQDLSDVLFFAEDVFGGQFCICRDALCTFDPETGRLEELAGSLDAWADNVLRDFEFRTGYPLAHDWQLAHGPMQAGTRLLPKVPFVLGGRYDLGNLYSMRDVEGMRFRASIANQIRDLPDGGQVTIR